MERLTRRSDTGHAYYPRCFEEPCGGDGCKINDCLFDNTICERLAAYEDTGLTSGEVHSMSGEWCAMMSVLNSIGGGYGRLRELAEADKDGRLVVLPCKVGDPVYLIVTKRARNYTPEFRFVKKSRLTFLNMERILQDFGKEAFLTREEAEEALEAMKK